MSMSLGGYMRSKRMAGMSISLATSATVRCSTSAKGWVASTKSLMSFDADAMMERHLLLARLRAVVERAASLLKRLYRLAPLGRATKN